MYSFAVVVRSLRHVRLWDPMGQAPPSFTISQSLLRFLSIESVMPSNHLILCHPFSLCLQSFPASGSFPVSWLFASSGQSIGASAVASVLPMNIQDWFPLEWTGWISLLSKGLSRVFSNTTDHKHQFFDVYSFIGPLLNRHFCLKWCVRVWGYKCGWDSGNPCLRELMLRSERNKSLSRGPWS